MDIRHRLAVVAGMLLGGVILLVLLFFLLVPRTPYHKLSFGNETFKVLIADNEKDRTKGLSGTDELPDKYGMLFVFEDDGFYGIWMKDMNYPIDIVWLNERKSVVHIEQHILPASYPRTYTSSVPARYVLELPADSTEKYGIKQGDVATFRTP